MNNLAMLLALLKAEVLCLCKFHIATHFTKNN